MKDREISREEAIKRLEEGEPPNELYEPQWEAALALAIKALKAEPVVRCKNCEHLSLRGFRNTEKGRFSDCPFMSVPVTEDGFCSFGKEKMPRLIDANAILKSEHQHYNPMADEYYVTVRDIENAPPVDAIPVEWIDEWVNNYCDRYEEELIDRLLRTWSEKGKRKEDG